MEGLMEKKNGKWDGRVFIFVLRSWRKHVLLLSKEYVIAEIRVPELSIIYSQQLPVSFSSQLALPRAEASCPLWNPENSVSFHPSGMQTREREQCREVGW